MLDFLITKKYAFEMSGGRKMYYSGGEKPPLADLDIYFRHGNKDHSPSFTFYFELFGYVVVDMSIYSIFHAEDCDE